MSESQPSAEGESKISGRAVVVAMFALGIVATSILWAYWRLHLLPFMPLQQALIAEFEGSSPRVDGGRRKMHKGTPMILRIVMRVPFDPTAEDVETLREIDNHLQRTQELAAEHCRLDDYELIELHLYQESQEDRLRQKTFQQELTAAGEDVRSES